jgi:hypothetical protein
VKDVHTNSRIPAYLYERARRKAFEQRVSINTLLVQGLRLRVGDRNMKYRIENVHIPISQGVARDGDEQRELPGRRIIHVFGPSQNQRTAGGDGRVLEVLTEEEE